MDNIRSTSPFAFLAVMEDRGSLYRFVYLWSKKHIELSILQLPKEWFFRTIQLSMSPVIFKVFL